MTSSSPEAPDRHFRVVMLAHWYPPCTAWPTAAARAQRFAHAFSANGYRVTVVAPLLDRSTCGCTACDGRPPPPETGPVTVRRIRVHRSKLHRAWNAVRPSTATDTNVATDGGGSLAWLRALFDVRTNWRASATRETRRLLAAGTQPTWLWTTAGPVESVAVGARLRHRALGWICDLRDPLTRPADPTAAARRVRRWRLALLRPLLSRADVVVAAAQGAAQVDGRWLGRDIVTVLTGFDPEDAPSGTSPDASTAQAGDVVLAYFGRLYPGWLELDVVCGAIARLPEEARSRVTLRYVGPSRTLARAAAERAGVADRLRDEPAVTAAIARQEMRSSTALVLQEPDGDHTRIPGKVFDYVATGRPILVVPGDGPAGALIRELELGATARSESELAALLSEWVATGPPVANATGRDALTVSRTLLPLLDAMSAVERAQQAHRADPPW